MPANDELLKRITARPEVFGGKPIIRDLRVSVELILSLLSQGVAPEAILEDYPDIEFDDIRACTGLRPRRHFKRHLGRRFRSSVILLPRHWILSPVGGAFRSL